MTPAENKIFTLAGLNATLRTALGTSPFRWCDRQLVQGYIPKTRGSLAPGGGTSSVRNRRISTIAPYLMNGGRSSLEQIRFQIDVLDLDPDICKQTAFSIVAFLATINLVTGDQLGSPPAAPPNFPNFVGNLRSGLEPQPGTIIYVESVDVVCYNSTLN
jgi:hypothetical protein